MVNLFGFLQRLPNLEKMSRMMKKNEAIFHFCKSGTKRQIFNEITYFKLLTEIVADEGDGEAEEIEFNKLKTLQLIHLASLISRSESVKVKLSKFSSLLEVNVKALSIPKLQHVQLTFLELALEGKPQCHHKTVVYGNGMHVSTKFFLTMSV
ncbi:hypothetical protein P3X46_025250 [Hevea brasiliensis]|uniref:FBD domain-containing protein n=1 Tax=Hevea brasiliensis TaxID=3981 RepID=A0ABQ9L4Y4_HEVBR|nr:hypothetical protein P3X46_025250 [Hevea brasiliensis]